jgi:hypothetical protein
MILEAMTGDTKAEEKLNEIMSIVNVLNDMSVDLKLTEFMGIMIAMFDEYCDYNEISPAKAHGELVKYMRIWDAYHGITA